LAEDCSLTAREGAEIFIRKPEVRDQTREQGDYLLSGLRDKHQNTEERREAKVTRAVLEQR
jgi:hypothetical protein